MVTVSTENKRATKKRELDWAKVQQASFTHFTLQQKRERERERERETERDRETERERGESWCMCEFGLGFFKPKESSAPEPCCHSQSLQITGSQPIRDCRPLTNKIKLVLYISTRRQSLLLTEDYSALTDVLCSYWCPFHCNHTNTILGSLKQFN